jgi:dipeptidyl aminopeptidase/acylaminoacyl peptidase
MSRFVVSLFLVLFPATIMADQPSKRPMTIDDLFKFKRVADPQISPDGQWVVYTLTTMDVAGNKSTTNLWLAATDGKTPPRQLTTTDKKDRHPRWSPDGKRILFESTRSGDSQLWIIDPTGGEARQLTTIATEANNAIWSRDGSLIAFVSAVYPEFSDKPFKESNEANKKKKEEIEKNPVKAKVFTKLFYRHWDSWVEDKRQHLFVMHATGGEPRDVTPGDRDAYPTSTTFETGENYTFSPDGKYLVFTAVPDKNEAWSTNYSICRVPVDPSASGGRKPEASGGRKPTDWECLTQDNPAASSGPVFSPDGKMLAYRAQKKPGYEADKWELLVVDTDKSGVFRGTPRNFIQHSDVDLSVESFAWKVEDASNPRIIYSAELYANTNFFQVNVNPNDATVTVHNDQKSSGVKNSLTISKDGRIWCYLQAYLHSPAEVVSEGRTDAFRLPELGPLAFGNKNISDANRQLLAELDMPRPEFVTVPGAGGASMQMWILRPPGFDPSKKYPLAYLVHGGPQGAWENGWSYRWCPEVWAAQGYVVALPNPRGSTGFGQKYVDEISGDWGGKCYEDLMAGVEYLEKQPYIDKDRMAAAGASFGGYMMNWFQGHTTKFKTLISHCGVYNFDSMYATTDEVWFDEWEHGGPPWEKRDSYEKFSPHRFAKNFKTPMLIIHNDNDFRVPMGQGFEMFQTLQRLGIPSKMINFPDESHWVLKPANSQFWHKEVFAWLAKYAPPGGK